MAFRWRRTGSKHAPQARCRSPRRALRRKLQSRCPSEYAEGVSPQLNWSPVADAKSYVVIVEDADAKPVTPFVHWLAWNIPARVTHLSEDLQEQMRLAEPEGVLQGATSRGSPGYCSPGAHQRWTHRIATTSRCLRSMQFLISSLVQTGTSRCEQCAAGPGPGRAGRLVPASATAAQLSHLEGF